MSPTLEKLYQIFGQVVFLPIAKGSKNPDRKGWQKITFADTQAADYQEELEDCVTRGGNVGVVHGPASEGLISIDLDRDELVDPFIARNLDLALTTRSRGRRGCNFFLRTKPGTTYPNCQAVYALRDSDGNKCGEWRCGGGNKGAQTVIFGVHPEGPTYQILVEISPVELVFDADLKWFYPFDSPGPAKKSAPPTGTTSSSTQAQNGQTRAQGQSSIDPQAAYTQMLDELGEPFIKTQRSYSINQPFFARIFGINRKALWDIKSKD